MQTIIAFAHSETKHLASAADSVKDTRVVHWYVLLRDDLDDLLGHHSTRESGCVVQLSAASASHLSGNLDESFVLVGIWDSISDIPQYFFG